MQEFTYTEQDMQIARNALDHILEEYKNAKSLIWAIAMKNGGTLQIDMSLLIDATNKGNKITTWNDPSSLSFCIKASRPTQRSLDAAPQGA